jgi:hypothetical protein
MEQAYFDGAGVVLKAAIKHGKPNPLIYSWYGKWLWATDKPDAAWRHVAKRAKASRASILYYLLSVFCSLDGEKERSELYMRAFRHFARREEERRASATDKARKPVSRALKGRISSA